MRRRQVLDDLRYIRLRNRRAVAFDHLVDFGPPEIFLEFRTCRLDENIIGRMAAGAIVHDGFAIGAGPEGGRLRRQGVSNRRRMGSVFQQQRDDDGQQERKKKPSLHHPTPLVWRPKKDPVLSSSTSSSGAFKKSASLCRESFMRTFDPKPNWINTFASVLSIP